MSDLENLKEEKEIEIILDKEKPASKIAKKNNGQKKDKKPKKKAKEDDSDFEFDSKRKKSKNLKKVNKKGAENDEKVKGFIL